MHHKTVILNCNNFSEYYGFHRFWSNISSLGEPSFFLDEASFKNNKKILLTSNFWMEICIYTLKCNCY